jgi:hypothetical protein
MCHCELHNFFFFGTLWRHCLGAAFVLPEPGVDLMQKTKRTSLTIPQRHFIGALFLLLASESALAEPSHQAAQAQARLQQLSQQLALRAEQIEPARQILREAQAARRLIIESDRAQRQHHRTEIEARWRALLSAEQMQSLARWREDNPPARPNGRGANGPGKPQRQGGV